MKKWVHRIQMLALCATSLAAVSVRAAEPLLPVEAFAALPLIEVARLSPGGQKLAMMVNNGGTTTLLTQDLATGARVGLGSTDHKEYSFNWIKWKADNRLLIGTRFPSRRSCRGGVGHATVETRLLIAKLDGGGLVNLLKPNSFRGDWQPVRQDNVVDFLEDQPNEVLLSLYERDYCDWSSDTEFDLGPSLVRLDIESGKRSYAQEPLDRTYDWDLDRKHQVRISTWRKGTKYEVRLREGDSRQWRTLWAFRGLSKDEVTPLGFGKNPNQLYVLANHEGRKALFTVDLADPALPRTLVLASPEFDISGHLVVSRKTGEVVGLQGTSNTDSAALNYWDKERSGLVSNVDEALPNRFNRFVSFSDDETRYLVFSFSDTVAGEYYLGDDKAGTLKLFAQVRPGLPESAMVPKVRKTIAARDGLKLSAFLSLPKNVEAKSLPTVLLVHGGPQSHDDAGFDGWAQFMANRGYAVLQVNFRGSTGRGATHMEAGLGRWGLEMQDDLTDATQWAIQQGFADPKRICIVGASYGGYAALMGLTKTPDLFRCGVSFAGVSDLRELIRDELRNWGDTEYADLQIGKDAERLKATSPRFFAAQIKAPLLLIHGDKDRIVDYEQSQFMDAALTAAGKPHWFVTLKNGGHNLGLHANSLLFYTELEKFLLEHLGRGAGR
ncbi:MAG: S9 family peptidase [Burkholderiales bacterium PBB3]|nr:MAG: S9 family peptidase [Burkholderiales bacterium PBB3]